ncbi:MAG: hypothetical protein FWD24_01775 [Treponema sp.]|nr:hypothetical protein [Treponema sp.]
MEGRLIRQEDSVPDIGGEKGCGMLGAGFFLIIFLLFPGILLHAQIESFRTFVDAIIEVTPEKMTGTAVNIGINNSVLINLGPEARFLRGIELEITAPQSWLQYRGALVMAIYNNINPQTGTGITDFSGNRIAFEALPNRLRIIYHIPIRAQHGLRTTTTVSVPSGIAQPGTFPIMFRLSQVMKGLPDEFERTTFNLVARPILSDEGAVRFVTRFPPQLRNRPFTVLINDNVISNLNEQVLLREGEHHLVVLSDDYRNESRRFIVERGRVIDLIIELQDPTPIIIFEAPQNARIFLNNALIRNTTDPVTVEPGTHEVRFQVGDYTVTRTLNIQRGRTYRIALAVDLTIQEDE